MPDIPSIGQNSVGPINRVQGAPPATDVSRVSLRREIQYDRVELSNHVRLLDRLRQMASVRSDLVDAVRSEIAAGTYETPQKLEAAVVRLLQELGGYAR